MFASSAQLLLYGARVTDPGHAMRAAARAPPAPTDQHVVIA